ncbi:MAG: hypothetical protein M3O85_03125 [Acidobacteriota bacterium]|nr:hypothetical protein [Acidobacteriota bacterium]
MTQMLRNLLLSGGGALIIGFASYYINRLMLRYGINPSTESLLDDLAIGSLGGDIVLLTGALRWERESRIHERLTLIAELNHHVRNALTTIVLYSEYPDLKQRLQRTSEAVDRIEWVLRDLVPTAAFREGKPRLLDKEG